MNLFFTEQKNIRSGAIIIQIKYFETSQFAKDLKKLLKRFKTLKDDLENLKRNQIELLHVYKIVNQGTFCSADGAKTFCQIRGYISTVRKNSLPAIDAIQAAFEGNPFIVPAES